MTIVEDALLRELLQAAANHGQASEPDHQVGDLEALVMACWARLSPAQRREVYEELPPHDWL